MSKGGPLLNCPKCGEIARCLSVPLAKADEDGSRNIHFTDQQDIRWYRRARHCSNCSNFFLTAEIDEKFLDELEFLRQRLIRKRKRKRQLAVNSIRQTNPWIERPETVPGDLVWDFLRESCWWLTHSSGNPVRAPRHAERMYLDKQHGWSVDFGANTFLAGKAINRSARHLKEFLDVAASGAQPTITSLRENLRGAIAGAVAHYDGNEYSGYYPISGNCLVFGAQAIDLGDAVSFLITKTKIDGLLVDFPC